VLSTVRRQYFANKYVFSWRLKVLRLGSGSRRLKNLPSPVYCYGGAFGLYGVNGAAAWKS